MIRKLKISICLSICLLTSGCGVNKIAGEVPELLDPPKSVSDTVKVTRGEIYNIDLFDAQIIPYTDELSFDMGGIIEDIKVKIGQSVKKGDLLASIIEASDNSEYTSVMDEIDSIDKASSEDNVLAEYDIRIMKLERNQLVKKLNKATQSNKAELKNEVAIKEADIRNAEQQLNDKKTIQKLDRTWLKKKAAKIKDKLSAYNIYASMDGVVTTISKKIGEEVGEGEFILSIADNNNKQIKTEYISSSQLKKMDRYYVKYNGKEYDVTLAGTDVSEQEDNNESSSYFGVKDNNADIRVGSYTNLYLISGYSKDSLIIPANALYNESSESYVYKQINGAKVRTEVSVGTITDTNAQITEGLVEGDEVYVQK